MTPMNAVALAAVAAVFSMVAAAVSVCVARARPQPRRTHEIGELECAVEALVRRLEVTAGRCIHDLESRKTELRRLLANEEPALADAPLQPMTPLPDVAATRDTTDPPQCFATDMLSRAARACALAEQDADEVTICRATGFQRAELRMLLSLRAAQQKAA